MGEIREYRGKRRDGKGWIFGYLSVRHPDTIAIFVPVKNPKELKAWDPCGTQYCVFPETVGQYTGIYTTEEIDGGDTECTFIYEGDIVEAVLTDGIHNGFSWGRHVVVFDRGAFGLKSRRGEITPMCNYAASVKFKVLGNIHDNPELLEVSE